jgi:hypothetical protein
MVKTCLCDHPILDGLDESNTESSLFVMVVDPDPSDNRLALKFSLPRGYRDGSAYCQGMLDQETCSILAHVLCISLFKKMIVRSILPFDGHG